MANASNDLTFEQVDQHLQGVDLSQFQAAPQGEGGAASLTNALPNICGIYQVVRPILVLVSKLPLIPQKWRDAITTFISVMDTFCPQ